MRIDEFDEYQGITSEMLGKWLDAHGWDKKPHFAFRRAFHDREKCRRTTLESSSDFSSGAATRHLRRR